jgi:hypothetical protein
MLLAPFLLLALEARDLLVELLQLQLLFAVLLTVRYLMPAVTRLFGNP